MTPSEAWEQMKIRHAKEERACLDQIASDAYCRGQAGEAPARSDRAMQILYDYARENSDKGVTVEMLRGDNRTARACKHRHKVMLRLREETDYSLPEIGRLLGGRDHTTVINGIERAKKEPEEAAQ